MNTGKVKIHGKEYLTVAYRVSNFREDHADWGIITEIVSVDDDSVIMKASVVDPDGRVIGTGFAEEKRASSQINRTSALENCETSAIGRALAACGYGGTEYASANEVENAIHQQNDIPPPAPVKISRDVKQKVQEQTLAALEKGDGYAIKQIWDEFSTDEHRVLWPMFSPQQRAAIKELVKEANG